MFGLVGLLTWWQGGTVLRTYGDWFDVGSPLSHKVDVVYVLGGGAETRPLVAAAILQKGYAQRVLVPNPKPTVPLGVTGLTEAELISAMLASEGIDQSLVTRLELPEDSTAGEVRALKEYADEHREDRFVIVTDHYHTRRCRWLLKRHCPPEVVDRVVLVSVPTDGFDASNWWQTESGLQAYLLESIKTVRIAAGR